MTTINITLLPKNKIIETSENISIEDLEDYLNKLKAQIPDV